LRTGVPKIVEVAQPAGRIPAKRGLSSVAAVAQSVGAKFVILGFNAVTGILCARVLLPAGRGELAAMILWPLFLASALTFGVPSALTFCMRSRPEKQSLFVGAALVFAGISGAIGTLLGILFLPAWIPQYSPDVIFYARLFVLSVPLAGLLLVGRAAFESRGDFSISNLLLLASPISTVIALLVLWRTHRLTPVTAACAYVLVGVPPALWMLQRLWRDFQPTVQHFVEATRELFGYGIRSYGIDLCGTMAYYVDQVLVVRMLAPSLMGTYVVALSLSRVLSAFHASVVMVLFPKAVNQPREEVREMTGRAVRMSTLLTAISGLAVVLCGPYLVSMLYGKDYGDATAVLRILILEVLLSGATLVLSQAFMALGRPGVITALQVLGLLLTVPLMLVLVPRYGLVGAGLSLLISTSARLISVLAAFPMCLKVRIPDVVPTAADVKAMIALAMRPLKMLRSKALTAVEGTD
jgi:O-antigen/teichoic acid export membrane protein